jgi:hypothetical protein
MLPPARPAKLRRPLPLIFGTLSLACSQAFAAVEFIPAVTLFADTSDNARLEGKDEAESASRMGLDAGFTLANFTETSSLTFEPRVTTDAYADSVDSELEATEYFVAAAGRKDGQKVGYGFDTTLQRQGILNAELEDAIPNDPDAEDPGDVETGRLVNFNEDRDLLRLRGNLDFTLSPRSAFNLLFERQSIDYSASDSLTAVSRRSDYDFDRLSLGVTRRIDTRNLVSARMFVSNYEAGANRNQTDSVGVEGRFTRPITRTWSFDFRAGVQRSDYEFLSVSAPQVVDNATTNYTFGAGLRNRTQRGSVNVNLVHAVSPSASGFLSVRDEISTYYRYDLTERVQMQLGARISNTETLDNVATANERDHATIDLGIEWALSRQMFLAFGYDFVRQEFVNESSTDTTANAITVGVTYRGMSRRER